MILLFSRQDDGSTKDVAEWLAAMGKNFLRINADDSKNKFIGCNVADGIFCIEAGGHEYIISLKEVTSVWNRRKGFCKESLVANEGLPSVFHTEEISAKAHLNNEANEVFDFLYYLLEADENIRHIGCQQHNAVNKLKVLKMAESCGLSIPKTYIVSKRKALEQLATNKNLITKAIGNGVYDFTDEYGYYSYTERLTKKFISELPETFFPSLIQEEIEKKYELRVFYLKGSFYAMAIFSQESSQTLTDSRKGYAAAYMPRRVPYQLPKDIEKHLKLLMDQLALNTGSIDLIVSAEGLHYFLEVNPIGQFGMTSQPCNYYLEKKIAENLC